MVSVRKANYNHNTFKFYICCGHDCFWFQIVDSTANLVTYIHEAIHQEVKVSLQSAALQCLLSLSRSFQQLRTTFQDVKLWEPVISALKSGTADDVISVASSVLCNLLLDFSPCKEVSLSLVCLKDTKLHFQ